jgi:hypothetical protein
MVYRQNSQIAAGVIGDEQVLSLAIDREITRIRAMSWLFV